MKNFIIYLSITFLFFWVNKKVIGQSQIFKGHDLSENGVNLKIKVNYVDSFYVLDAQIKVTEKRNFFVQKNMRFKDFFSRGKSELADCYATIFLSKIVMNREMIWAPNDYGTLYGDVYNFGDNILNNKVEMLKLKYTDSVNVSVKLNNIYPLEIGNYTINLSIKIKYKEKWYNIHSDYETFEVDKLPPKKANFHTK
jgi:hypothetical protein